MNKNIKLSKRLSAAADMVSPGMRLADIGTDHAYVPIFLCQTGKIPSAVAMDIGRGPLARAKEHIASCGMQDYICTRLSDGAKSLLPNEAESILIAGMGGGLVIKILEESREIFHAAKEIILQPQSKLCEVRIYLRQNGYVSDREDMVYEEGKFYPMMRVNYRPAYCGRENALYDRYGKILLSERHPVLYRYLQKEKETYESILAQLQAAEQTERIRERMQETLGLLNENKQALNEWK